MAEKGACPFCRGVRTVDIFFEFSQAPFKEQTGGGLLDFSSGCHVTRQVRSIVPSWRGPACGGFLGGPMLGPFFIHEKIGHLTANGVDGAFPPEGSGRQSGSLSNLKDPIGLKVVSSRFPHGSGDVPGLLEMLLGQARLDKGLMFFFNSSFPRWVSAGACQA